MSAIRPGLPLNTPAQGLDLPSARNAQAAFFRAALSQAAAPQAPPPQALAPAAAVMSTIRTATPARPAEAPVTAPPREEPRIMRPGSYLDIRV
ncbi:MAG: hypothetical protein ACK4MI_13510 [Brevundimonas sp.]|uniref:hypothetical protein n=1 Tax=Brevundimonas sp. TaxID=1871086 RepID=UPI0028D12702|nr:hypothetical protein [uncultured Brevundimonas sp.]